MNEPDIALPPLPEPTAWTLQHSLAWIADPERTPTAYTYAELTRNSRDDPDRERIYSADQMLAFARQAVLAERERCAKIVDGVCPALNQMDLRSALAAAIRKGQA